MNLEGSTAQTIQGIIVPIAFLLIFYFIAIRPQQKREKEIREMREALKVGDEIITIGGIYGKVIKIKDEIVTIEVGSDKSKLDISKWAIGNVTKKKENKKGNKKADKKEVKNENEKEKSEENSESKNDKKQ